MKTTKSVACVAIIGFAAICSIGVYVALEARNAWLKEILLAEAPTNCPPSGCAIVYRVADGRRMAVASVGKVSPKFVYEPGIVVSPFTVLAAIDRGFITVDTLYETNRDDARYRLLPGDNGHVWPEKMSIGDAIVHSSNIVLGKLGYDLGPKIVVKTFAEFGLGTQGGHWTPWERMDRASWSRVPIGQGMYTTPDELARAYVILANRGKSPWTGKQVVKETVADSMNKVLCRVVSKDGTARRAAVEGVTVAGKTGTAQRMINDRYVQLFNATFVGFFPAEKPEYVVAVVYQTEPSDRKHQGGHRPATAFAHIVSTMLEESQTPVSMPRK